MPTSPAACGKRSHDACDPPRTPESENPTCLPREASSSRVARGGRGRKLRPPPRHRALLSVVVAASGARDGEKSCAG
eukprot:349954-Chlamydomonas_euryale.AAC.4